MSPNLEIMHPFGVDSAIAFSFLMTSVPATLKANRRNRDRAVSVRLSAGLCAPFS